MILFLSFSLSFFFIICGFVFGSKSMVPNYCHHQISFPPMEFSVSLFLSSSSILKLGFVFSLSIHFAFYYDFDLTIFLLFYFNREKLLVLFYLSIVQLNNSFALDQPKMRYILSLLHLMLSSNSQVCDWFEFWVF
jgi:hypothetical protein